MRSTVGTGSTMIVRLTLTSPVMFLLLPKSRSGICFSIVLVLARSVGYRINVAVMEGWQEGMCGSSFVWSAEPVSLYSLHFAPNFGGYLVCF